MTCLLTLQWGGENGEVKSEKYFPAKICRLLFYGVYFCFGWMWEDRVLTSCGGHIKKGSPGGKREREREEKTKGSLEKH